MCFETHTPSFIGNGVWSMTFKTHTPYSILENHEFRPKVKEYLGRCSSISIDPFSAAGKENECSHYSKHSRLVCFIIKCLNVLCVGGGCACACVCAYSTPV